MTNKQKAVITAAIEWRKSLNLHPTTENFSKEEKAQDDLLEAVDDLLKDICPTCQSPNWWMRYINWCPDRFHSTKVRG